MKKIWITIGLIAVVVLVILLAVTQTKKEPGEIKIGSILSLTGRGAKFGIDSKNAIDLAVEKINTSNEYPFTLKVIYEDDKGEASTAVSALRKLIEVDNVPVIVGFILSNNALACAPIAESKKVNLLITNASAEKIKDAGDYIFRIRETAATNGKEMAKYSRDTLNVNTSAILYANAENGVSYAQAFRDKSIELGGKILLSEAFEEGEKDFRSLILKIKEKDPEAVYLAGLPPEMGQILYQSKEQGFRPKFWLGSSGAEDPMLIEIAKEGAEDLIISSPPFDLYSEDEKVQNFVKKYKAKYNYEPGPPGANAYDAIYIIAEVIKKYGKTADDIKRGLYQVKNYNGVGGNITIDEFGEVQRPVLFKKVINGRFEIIR